MDGQWHRCMMKPHALRWHAMLWTVVCATAGCAHMLTPAAGDVPGRLLSLAGLQTLLRCTPPANLRQHTRRLLYLSTAVTRGRACTSLGLPAAAACDTCMPAAQVTECSSTVNTQQTYPAASMLLPRQENPAGSACCRTAAVGWVRLVRCHLRTVLGTPGRLRAGT